MGELLRLDYGHYTNKIDTKKDHWNTNKIKIINNKIWTKREFEKAYIKLKTEYISNGGVFHE